MTEIERLAGLLRLLAPVPAGWVQGAQELPLGRSALDEIVARAEEDAAFRQALLDDLESALAAAGFHRNPGLVDALRRRLVS